MKFTYMKTTIYPFTFKNRRIKYWVEKHVQGKVLNLFAGKIKLNCDEIRNDLRKSMPADYHMDALEFVKKWRGQKFDTILLDPPYGYRKSMEFYEGAISSPFNQIKNYIPKILSPNGVVITFGYHSNVMSKRRSFTQEHLLLISPGGSSHDTIAIIERFKKRIPNTAFFEKNNVK